MGVVIVDHMEVPMPASVFVNHIPMLCQLDSLFNQLARGKRQAYYISKSQIILGFEGVTSHTNEET